MILLYTAKTNCEAIKLTNTGGRGNSGRIWCFLELWLLDRSCETDIFCRVSFREFGQAKGWGELLLAMVMVKSF